MPFLSLLSVSIWRFILFSDSVVVISVPLISLSFSASIVTTFPFFAKDFFAGSSSGSFFGAAASFFFTAVSVE